ncbi:MAG: FeoA family protein [Bacteroidetes bacterium]|nr:FeoA family protein [Bacteroidota bacterium]
MRSLLDLTIGQKAVLADFIDERLPVKLMELGCLPGNEVELLQIAPLNDPLYYLVAGNRIAIRRETASLICLETDR